MGSFSIIDRYFRFPEVFVARGASKSNDAKAAFWDRYPIFATASWPNFVYSKYFTLAVNVPAKIKPMEFLEIEPDKILDHEAMEERRKPPANADITVRPTRAIPRDMDDQLEARSPQFFLRNTARYEKSVPERMPWNFTTTQDREWDAMLGEIRSYRYEQPELRDRMMIDEVRAYQRGLRFLIAGRPWYDFFGKDVKRNLSVTAMWKFNPVTLDEDGRPSFRDETEEGGEA